MLSISYLFQIERALKGITIEMNHMGCRRRKVIGVSNEPVNQQLLYVLTLHVFLLYIV